MPRKYTIHPESLITPNQFSPYLTVYFRRGVESRDPIYPASNLQLSFSLPNSQREVFAHRVPARDIVRSSDCGLCAVNLPRDDVPKHAAVRRQGGLLLEGKDGAGAGPGDGDDDIVVRLHAWEGERHLGVWEVGRLSGGRAVD